MTEHIEKVRGFLREKELDAIIVSNYHNRRYISGFSGSAALLVVFPQETLLLTDFRYMEQARRQASGCKVVEHGNRPYEDMGKALASCTRVGYEENYLSVGTFEKIKAALGEKEWFPVNLDALRVIKDDDELVLINDAVAIADRAFARLLPELRIGMAEIEAAALLEFYLRQEGAEGVSFPTIVASGERSALPHGQPTAKKIAAGDLVIFDFGATYNGYCSDMTRTVVFGKAAAAQKKIYDIVLAAQLKALSILKPGITGKDGDAAAREVINAAGYGKYFGHGTGHSLGLAVHEEPRLSPSCGDVLLSGMIMSVEPGIYIPGWGGARIEDLVVITGEGSRILTKTPKQLLELSN